jgi:hypothetical protein
MIEVVDLEAVVSKVFEAVARTHAAIDTLARRLENMRLVVAEVIDVVAVAAAVDGVVAVAAAGAVVVAAETALLLLFANTTGTPVPVPYSWTRTSQWS